MRKVTKGLLMVGVAALAFGACGDTVEVFTPEPAPPPPPPVIPPITFPVPPTPPPPVNQAPQAVGSIPAAQVAAGATSTFDAAGYFSDPDGDELTYSAGSSNEAAATISMDGSSATITGVADGTAVVTITARDPDGAAAAQSVSVTVGDGVAENRSPVAVGTIPAHDVDVGGAISIRLGAYFSDPDGDALTYGAESSNADAASTSVEGATVTISGVADGKAVVTVTASDPDGESAAQTVSVTIGDGDSSNTPPVAQGSIPDHSVGVGGTVTVDVTGYFSDADGDELSYMASSSNADVATASMVGTTVTIEGVAAGQAVINVIASDGESTVAQGFNVTVEAAPVNTAPTAVGTIPAHSVNLGGSATIDVAGYFSDADADELSYTAASSNAEVATATMEGSTATITGVAAGGAVVTVTANDGSAAVSQGFNVTVIDPSGTPATVALFGLRSVTDRNQSIDPTNVSGDVSVLVDVQWNDETPGSIDLTLGDQVISCRGTSADAASPVGLADSSGQVEVDCFFDTDDVMGECTGMQLAPLYANGEHELGARITTADGTVREALVSQMITLKNSNYVLIDYNPGGTSLVVSGVTYYGGPSSEDNLNTFDVCPVAYDGTVVGTIGLRGATTTPDANSVSFLTHRSGRYGEYWGVRRNDSEPPFTFTALSSQNAGIEDIASDGGGHMIIQDGTILDPDGLDITGQFVPGDMENDLTEIGPIYFDFWAPRLGGSDAPSEVQIGGESVMAETYYSDVKDRRAQALSVSNLTEAGSGGSRGITSQVIAVGDCSVAANVDTGERGAGTAFVAIIDDANVVADIPEDDPVGGELSDDGGVDCYTAELQSLADPLSNSRSMTRTRIRAAAFFGVDRGAPVTDNEEPDEELVLKGGEMLTFDVEDPDLETGELGSGVKNAGIIAFSGPSLGRAYWVGSSLVSVDDEGRATIPSHVGRTSVVGLSAGEDGRHTVTVWIPDNASPSNYGATSFTFVRDTKAPTFTVSSSQSDIGRTNSPTVVASVGGTISDATAIQKAELSIRKIAMDGSQLCSAGEELSEGRTGRVSRNKRDLENDANSITFDESFTIKAGTAPERYCFLLEVEDSAVESDGRGDGNENSYEVGSFSVDWPTEPVALPDPTFEFKVADGTEELEDLDVDEGSPAADNMYDVYLANVETEPTTESPLEVTISHPATLTVTPTTLTFDGSADSVQVSVESAHDLNITSEMMTLTHTATGYDDAALPVNVMDDDFAISASPSSVREDADAADVTVTVTAGSMSETVRTVSVTFTAGTGTDAVDFTAINSVDIEIAAMMTSGMAEVEVNAADDAEQDEANESIVVAAQNSTEQGVYVAPAMIMILDDDPDVQLSANMTEVDEDAGTVTVELTATAASTVGGIVNFSLVLGGTAEGSGTDYTASPSPVALQIDGGQTTGTATVTLDIEDDPTDEPNETIVFADADGAEVGGGGKTYTIGSVTVTIMDNDDP